MPSLSRNNFVVFIAAIGFLNLFAATAWAQKVYLNPSDQSGNPIAGGGVESTYALINANNTKSILTAAGFTIVVDQDFTNAPANANSWGADTFVSIHSNAGGGHGTVTLYYPNSTPGQTMAKNITDALVAKLNYSNRGVSARSDLHVLNDTSMTAVLTEVVFHDCASSSGYQGHPPSESNFLKSTEGQKLIAEGIANGVCTYYSKSCQTTTPPADKGTLIGVVYKNPDLAARLPGATVKLNTGASVTASSPNAVWQFELAPGQYTVTASLDGYQTASKTATVIAGKETWASVGLTPVGEPVPVVDGGAGTVVDDAGNPSGLVDDSGLAISTDGGKKSPTGDHPEDGCCRLAGTSGGNIFAMLLILGLGFALTSFGRLRRRF